jgi:phosphatidate phosphatase PAH1
MKNESLKQELKQNVLKYRQEQQEKEKEREEKLKEKAEKEERKKAEKRVGSFMKNLNRYLTENSKRGEDFFVADTIFKDQMINGSGNEVKDLSIYHQLLFKALEDGGYEPELVVRKMGDRPTAYHILDAPYNIIISWGD